MSQANALEQLMLNLINEERAAAGVQPLIFDDRLNDSSEDHSAWMLDSNRFSHTGDGGSSPTARMEAAGFEFEGSWRSGENIGWQSERGDPGLEDDVAQIHESLMRSPGHRANILNPDFEEIGIGIESGDFTSGGTYDSVMVTQNFATTDAQDPQQAAPTEDTDPPVVTTGVADPATDEGSQDPVDTDEPDGGGDDAPDDNDDVPVEITQGDADPVDAAKDGDAPVDMAKDMAKDDGTPAQEGDPAVTAEDDGAPADNEDPVETAKDDETPGQEGDPAVTAKDDATPADNEDPVETAKDDDTPGQEGDPAVTAEDDGAPADNEDPVDTAKDDGTPAQEGDPVNLTDGDEAAPTDGETGDPVDDDMAACDSNGTIFVNFGDFNIDFNFYGVDEGSDDSGEPEAVAMEEINADADTDTTFVRFDVDAFLAQVSEMLTQIDWEPDGFQYSEMA